MDAMNEAFKELPLSRGKVAIVDASDYEWLSQWKWHVSSAGYAVRNHCKDGKRTLLGLHRVIVDAPDDLDVDHRDGDLLNNRRSNLRIATTSQNCMNRRPMKGASSQYKGVSWMKRPRKWIAYIKINGKQHFLGYFDDEIEAARTYDLKAMELHGEYARLNFTKEN